MKTLEDIKAAAAQPIKGKRELVLPVSGKFCLLRSPTLDELRAESILRKTVSQEVAMTWLLAKVMLLEGHEPGTALRIAKADLLQIISALAELALEILPTEGDES